MAGLSDLRRRVGSVDRARIRGRRSGCRQRRPPDLRLAPAGDRRTLRVRSGAVRDPDRRLLARSRLAGVASLERRVAGEGRARVAAGAAHPRAGRRAHAVQVDHDPSSGQSPRHARARGTPRGASRRETRAATDRGVRARVSRRGRQRVRRRGRDRRRSFRIRARAVRGPASSWERARRRAPSSSR